MRQITRETVTARARSRRPGIDISLLWTGGEDVPVGRLLAAGAIIWGLYGLAHVLVNGVVLDEVLEFAQIITGSVSYPAGHPHLVYYPRVYNLIHFLAAGAWALQPEPWLISAVRNVMFLFLSTFVPYALTTLLTRQPGWGHVAGALTATETVVKFQGVYPLWVFPIGYSNGHIGIHVALLAVVLFLARTWRTGGVLAGLLPAIHPAMPVIVWPWSAAYLLLARDRHRGRDRRRLIAAIGAGIAVCAALAVALFFYWSNLGPEPQYPPGDNAPVDGEAVRAGFTRYTDPHRQFGLLLTFGYLVGPVAFFAIGGLLWWGLKRQRVGGAGAPADRDCLWLLGFGALVGVYLYGSYLVHLFWGKLPSLVDTLMPMRFSNFFALLLIPVTVAAVAVALKELPAKLSLLALALFTGVVLLAGLLMAAEGRAFSFLYRGRVAETLIFRIWAVLFAVTLFASWPDRRRSLASLLGFGAVAGSMLVLYRSTTAGVSVILTFLAACALLWAGAIVVKRVNLDWLDWQRLRAGMWAVMACACLIICGAALQGRDGDVGMGSAERWDTMSDYDLELSRWLAANARPDEMILPAVFPRTKLQAKTNHPVLMELETLWLMTYIPRLATPIGTMTRDLYGIDYSDQSQLARISENGLIPLWSPHLLTAWKSRTREEWQRLGRKYRFRLVLAPTDVTLDLQPLLPGPVMSLYEIPANAAR